jgi:hypothetical protein
MAIKRYIATADNTITNAYQMDLSTKGTGSNMGAADALEAFYIYGQVSTGVGAESKTAEKSRILIQFDTAKINEDRTNGLIPASGNVAWYLNLYNAPHSFTLPKNFTMSILTVSSSWQEGYGLDMENYTDQTYEGTGSNWIRRGASGDGYVAWTAEGGDFLEIRQVITASQFASYTASFVDGTEDLSVDVSEVVEKWLEGATANYGFGVFLSSSYETGSHSYYTKKFFARSSEYFFLRPNLEARFDSAIKDDAAYFVKSSSLATAEDNLNTLYLYNYVKGKLQNIPANSLHSDTNQIYVSLYSGSTGNVYDKLPLPVGGDVVASADLNATGGIYIGPEGAVTGIYTASIAMSHSLDSVYATWHYEDLVSYHTSSEITVNTINASNHNPDPDYVTTIDNLKAHYSRSEEARFRLFVRSKNWNPNNYTVMQTEAPSEIIEDAYYSLYRIVDDYVVIPYGTGSAIEPQATGSAGSYTRLSYDISGNYFDLDMSLLQAGYQYGLKFAYYQNGSYREQEEVFKFKVE